VELEGCLLLERGSSRRCRRRDQLLLQVVGSPDPRQIDGIGGAHPLTSKIAVVNKADDEDADIDYLFLQTGIEDAFVTDQQNCGNILAGIGPFAIERGLCKESGDEAKIRIRMLNTNASPPRPFDARRRSGLLWLDDDRRRAGDSGRGSN